MVAKYLELVLVVWQRDIRQLHILIMASLLLSGVLWRDFTVRPKQILLIFILGNFSQWLFSRLLKIEPIGFLSSTITCFGISLLLRSNHLWVPALATMLAIGAKFFIRYNDKHLFNPAMLGVMIGINFLPGSWISPGQWGYELAMMSWLMAFGLLVASRARTLEMSLYFLAFYSLLLAGRVIYMGYEWNVWYHQFQSGSLILFTFFMISDPKTGPDHAIARLLHTALVALLAFIWQFYFYWNHNLIYALFIGSFVIPFWDKWLPARKFQWPTGKKPMQPIQLSDSKG